MSTHVNIDLQLVPDVHAATRGDHAAFERLVDATRSTVSSIALAILRDTEMSRDVAQDVYLAVWRDLGRLRDAGSFMPWLRQLTRNRAHHVLRSHVRARRRITGGEVDTLLAAAADPRPDAIERLVAHEDRAALAEAIAALPTSAREIVVLYYREGRSTRQVAELLGIDEAAVRKRLERARDRLRTSLAQHLQATAPSAAFTAAVMSAIAVAAPSTAAAAVVASGSAIKAAGGSKLFGGSASAAVPALATTGALLGALFGLLGGWAGVLFGARSLQQLARDDEERRGIRRFAIASMAATLGFIVVVLAKPEPLPVTLAFLLMFAAFGALHFIWLPRITARRMAAEWHEDRDRAARAARTRRRHALLGYLVGGLLGGAAVAASWFY